jgi:hypothetical protein
MPAVIFNFQNRSFVPANAMTFFKGMFDLLFFLKTLLEIVPMFAEPHG